MRLGGIKMMKKFTAILLTIIMIFALFPQATMVVEANQNSVLPPQGGIDNKIYHPHAWGASTVEYYLSSATIETLYSRVRNVEAAYLGYSTVSTVIDILELLGGGTVSIPKMIIEETAVFIVSGTVNGLFREIDNANFNGNGVIITLGASQLGRNSVGVRSQFIHRPDRPQFSVRHDNANTFSFPNNPQGHSGLIARSGTVVTAVGNRACAFNTNGIWWLLDTGVWINGEHLQSGIVRNIEINTSSSPSDGGRISGGGRVHFGQRVNLNAWPSAGWEFDGWYEGGRRISENRTFSFDAGESRNIQARFQDFRDLTISTTAYPSEGGRVFGGGRARTGQQVSLRATQTARWEFVGWYEGGIRISEESIYMFEARENRTIQAHFRDLRGATSQAPTPAPTQINAQEFERRVFELTNEERRTHGLPALIWDDTLADAARAHSRDMAENNFFSHTGSDGSNVGDRLTRFGISYAGAAENISRTGSPTPEDVVTGWMNSSGHRANILNQNMTHLGVGFHNLSDSRMNYITQNFARGLQTSVSSAPDSAPAGEWWRAAGFNHTENYFSFIYDSCASLRRAGRTVAIRLVVNQAVSVGSGQTAWHPSFTFYEDGTGSFITRTYRYELIGGNWVQSTGGSSTRNAWTFNWTIDGNGNGQIFNVNNPGFRPGDTGRLNVLTGSIINQSWNFTVSDDGLAINLPNGNIILLGRRRIR
jgi:uncharacterized protein YkwD